MYLQGDTMKFQLLVKNIQKMFLATKQNEIEEFILSKDPKSAADIEHWLLQYNYNKINNWISNA